MTERCMKIILIRNSQVYYFRSVRGKLLTKPPETNEISEIDSKLLALYEQVDKARSKTRKLIEKRDKLNEEFRKIRQEVQEARPQRDYLNEKVQTLKLLRDESRTKTRSIIEDIKTRQEKIAELRKKAPRQSYARLKKEQDDIEWKIQTTSLDLQEEKRLIEIVKQLEIQMEAYKKVEKQLKKIADLRRELKVNDNKADAFHQELSASAQKSQEIHQKIVAKIDESKKIKSEADCIHQTYLKARLEVEPLSAELRGLLEKKRKLQQALKDEDEKKRRTSEQALKEKLGRQAREKLQRGEKLSWEEFQLLESDDDNTKN
jgi:uncharacterized coiled-coil DUF342 family protein